MQLVDSKLYTANLTTASLAPANLTTFGTDGADLASRRAGRRLGAGYGESRFGRGYRQTGRGLIARLKRSSASERLLALMLAAFVVAASPAMLATVRSAVSVALQILLQAGHAGFIAFQIFAR